MKPRVEDAWDEFIRCNRIGALMFLPVFISLLTSCNHSASEHPSCPILDEYSLLIVSKSEMQPNPYYKGRDSKSIVPLLRDLA